MRIGNGVLSGLMATIAMSGLMVLKEVIGALPEFNAIAILATVLAKLVGSPVSPMLAWFAHFVLGSIIWGSLFAVFSSFVPGPYNTFKGIVFSIAIWLAMMTVFMPFAGAGQFGLSLSAKVPALTLMMHLLYGVVLGSAFGTFLGHQDVGERFNID